MQINHDRDHVTYSGTDRVAGIDSAYAECMDCPWAVSTDTLAEAESLAEKHRKEAAYNWDHP